MKPFPSSSDDAPPFGAMEDSECITVCACDQHGRIHFANGLFRRYVREVYGWAGEGEPFSIETVAQSDSAYLRERSAFMARALGAKGEPVRAIELTGGRAIEHTGTAWTSHPGSADSLCVITSAKAVFDDEQRPATHAADWFMVPTDPHILGDLTHAELETLRFIGLGLSTDEIAERLSRTKKAIERRRMSIRRKLAMTDRMALVRLAIESGLGSMPEETLPEFVRACRSRARHLKRLGQPTAEPAQA